jgi:hypothetical protein
MNTLSLPATGPQGAASPWVLSLSEAWDSAIFWLRQEAYAAKAKRQLARQLADNQAKLEQVQGLLARKLAREQAEGKRLERLLAACDLDLKQAEVFHAECEADIAAASALECDAKAPAEESLPDDLVVDPDGAFVDWDGSDGGDEITAAEAETALHVELGRPVITASFDG